MRKGWTSVECCAATLRCATLPRIVRGLQRQSCLSRLTFSKLNKSVNVMSLIDDTWSETNTWAPAAFLPDHVLTRLPSVRLLGSPPPLSGDVTQLTISKFRQTAFAVHLTIIPVQRCIRFPLVQCNTHQKLRCMLPSGGPRASGKRPPRQSRANHPPKNRSNQINQSLGERRKPYLSPYPNLYLSIRPKIHQRRA